MHRPHLNGNRRHAAGFTLLELIITLAILLVLFTVGTASFKTISNRTADQNARSLVDRVVFLERAWLARNATWASDPSVLKPGRGITIVTTASTGPGIVSITVTGDNRLGVATLSESGSCLAAVIGDPLTDASQTSVTLGSTSVCSGAGALAAVPA